MVNSYPEVGLPKNATYVRKHRNLTTMNNLIQTLLDGYESPVFLSDAEKGKVVYVNDAAEQALGISRQKVKGTRLKDLVHQDTVISSQPLVEHEGRFYLVQDENFTFSGDKFIKSTLKPFSDETALSYFNLQQQMASRIVHRMRSPLTGALGFAELLEETSLDDQQLKYIGAVEKGLDDMKSVLAELKILGEDIEVQNRKVDFRLLAEQVIGSLSEESAARVVLTIDEKSESIETSFILLTSIIEELLSNAFCHGADNVPVQLQFLENRIRIHNDGTPIPRSLAPYIFYPFFAGKARSMGIGLAKCAYYAYQLGIEIKLAENSREKGISFDIIL